MSNEPDVFNYETHTEREFEDLLEWLRGVGYEVNKTAAPTAKDGQGDDTTQERGYHD